MLARRRGSVEPETSMEFKSEYCGLREMGLWFIQIQQSFQSVQRYTFIWCWFRRASGTWQEMAVWCVLEEVDGELGVLLKTCVFLLYCVRNTQRKRKTFPIRKSFLNESGFVLKICLFPLPFCLSQSGSSRLELTKRLMVQHIYWDPFVFLHGKFSRGAWTTADTLSKIRLCCSSSAKW